MSNINFGESNIIVKYLQYFLHDRCSNIYKISNFYDDYTHSKLLEYLDMPNIIKANEIVKYLKTIEVGTGSGTSKPFNEMQYHIDGRTIVFHYKNPKNIVGFNSQIESHNAQYLKFKEIVPKLKSAYNTVESYLNKNGWRIVEYPSLYANVSTITEDIIKDRESITVVLKNKTPTNIFPHYDFRYMVNYFSNIYVNNVEISSGYFKKSSTYRVALLQCNPGDTFILSHSYSYSIPIKIGYCTENISELQDALRTSTNNTVINISKVSKYTINRAIPGHPILIKVPDNDNRKYNTILIQLPLLKYTKQENVHIQSPLAFTDNKMIVGDLNNDGVVDDIDYLTYYIQRAQESGTLFTTNYNRYEELCNCVENRYKTLFFNDGKYSLYNHKELSTKGTDGSVVYNIDTLVDHLKVIGMGSDISFKRYIINGEISYKIILGKQSKHNYDVIFNELSEYDDDGSEYFLEYINGIINASNEFLGYYLTDIGFVKSEINDGIVIKGNKDMTANSLLVIKTNPSDEIDDCSKILNGIYTVDRNTLTLPIEDFKTNPWMVREEFIPAILDMYVTPYSKEEDIGYVYDLIEADNSNTIFNLLGDDKSIYTEELRVYIQSLQTMYDAPFSLGYFDAKMYNVLFDSAYTNSIMNKNTIGGY